MTMTDLNPDALAALEAKLVADLEMVRRVRALLLEHQGALQPAPATTPPPAPAAPAIPALPPKPAKSEAERLTDALAALPSDTFRAVDFRRVLRQEHWEPSSLALRGIFQRLIRTGRIEVAQPGQGRAGSLYRRLQKPSAAPILRPETVDLPADSSVNLPDVSIKPEE